MDSHEQRIERLEERVAHLLRTVDELSEVVARQDRELMRMQRRQDLLLQREAAREASEGPPPEAERPPHY